MYLIEENFQRLVSSIFYLQKFAVKKAKDFEKEKEPFDEGQSDLVSVISILFFFFFFWYNRSHF